MSHIPTAPAPADKYRTYKPVVARLVAKLLPASILDIGAGDGWLAGTVNHGATIDGIDWAQTPLKSYRATYITDLNAGFPEGLPQYDCIVSCEVIAFLTNPGLFFNEVHRHLKAGGIFVISTPNTWYPQSRLQFFLRGFFPSFPNLAGRLQWGSYMHLVPWNFPQLYNFLALHGFSDIRLHECPEPRPKHLFEWLLAAPSLLYTRLKLRRAKTDEERTYWKHAGSRQALLGRRLVVTARRPL